MELKTMTVYEVWDFDPMDGSAGANYLADVFANRKDAIADVERRNMEARQQFIANASNGRARADAEPWQWRRAYWKERVVK
jgi:hypothetical protein